MDIGYHAKNHDTHNDKKGPQKVPEGKRFFKVKYANQGNSQDPKTRP